MNVYDKYEGCGWYSSKSDEYRQKFNKYLTRSGLDTCRFIDIQHGSKQSNNTFGCTHCDVSGNYAILAGGGLVIVQVDRDEGIFNILPDTLTVESPHGEKTLFYNVEGDTATEIEKVSGESDFAVLPSGWVWVDNVHVMGPGSRLDADGCRKDGCDTCDLAGGGYYEVSHAPEPPITTISTNTLIRAIVESGGSLGPLGK